RYFATGQVVAAKAKQIHSLDAAAYSGALVQARALNMLAFLNRSQVGHQIAMAHLVTLGSWAAFGGTQARQVRQGNPPAHLITMLFGARHGTAYLAARSALGFESMAQAQGALASAYAAHDRVVHQVFGTVQDAIVSGLPEARWAAMQEVLKRNYPGASFTLSLKEDNWSGYLRRHAAQQSLRPFIQTVAQMYDFLGPRNYIAKNPWPVESRCPAKRHELRRRGTTELDPAGRWQSIDTQSFHALRSNRWIGCYYREYPMGWGWIPGAAGQPAQTPYVEDAPDNFSTQDFWRWVKEATNWDITSGDANPLANSRAVASRQRWQGGGLPTYFDTGPHGSNSPLRFRVELQQSGPEGLTVTTNSAAESFFERPEPRADGLQESAHLFQPYWQARISPLKASNNIGGESR
ncbi:MAG TPA: hypothetical protein VIP51_09920, partial [Eoetvoesiella sp.]